MERNAAQNPQITHVQIPFDPSALSLACEFDHNGQCADCKAEKHELDGHDRIAVFTTASIARML